MQNHRLIASAILLFGLGTGIAVAQQPAEVYAIQTAPKNGCPGLALHITVAGRTIKGFAALGDMSAMSRVSGTRNGLGRFDMTMTPVQAGGPTGRIVGDASQTSTSIRARITGSKCYNGALQITSLQVTNAPE